MKKIKSLKVVENPESIKALWVNALSHRNQLLINTDWTQLPDSGLTPECVLAFKVWRNKLRIIKANSRVPVEAVVNTVISIGSEMPKLVWLDDSQTTVENFKYNYKKSARDFISEILSETELDYKILLGRSSLSKTHSEYNKIKEYVNIIQNIKDILSDFILSVDNTLDTELISNMHKNFLEKVGGYRYRLLEIFKTRGDIS